MPKKSYVQTDRAYEVSLDMLTTFAGKKAGYYRLTEDSVTFLLRHCAGAVYEVTSGSFAQRYCARKLIVDNRYRPVAPVGSMQWLNVPLGSGMDARLTNGKLPSHLPCIILNYDDLQDDLVTICLVSGALSGESSNR